MIVERKPQENDGPTKVRIKMSCPPSALGSTAFTNKAQWCFMELEYAAEFPQKDEEDEVIPFTEPGLLPNEEDEDEEEDEEDDEEFEDDDDDVEEDVIDDDTEEDT